MKCAGILFFAAIAVAQVAPPSGSVEGTVINSVTGVGIGGASVAVLAPGQPGRYETTSDGAGHFKITGVAPGNYRTSVEKEGFSPPKLELGFLSNSTLRIVSGGDAVKLEIALTPLHKIVGRVLGANGRPIAGMEVSVSPNLLADVAITDGEGRFALENLRTGSYTLIAKPPESAKPEVAADGSRTSLVTTYYPSVAERLLAQPIVFGEQGDFGGGYDIRMQTAAVHSVRGIVLSEDGKPLRGVELSLFPAPVATPGVIGPLIGPRGSSFAMGMLRAPNGEPEATAITGEDGRFEFPSVRSGDWRIVAVTDPMRDPQTGPSAKASMRVGRGDVDDLQIQIATPFKVTGTIEWKAGDPGSQRTSGARLLFDLATLVNPDSNEFVANGIVEGDKLSFENVLSGRYKVVVKPGLSAQIFLGGSEVVGSFPVSADGPPLRVVLKTWAGSVRGTVEKGAGATVLLVPQRAEGLVYGHAVVCDASGAFELNDVSPGDYYVAAFDRVEGFSASAAMLGLMPSRGRSVKVEERGVANVMLSVIAGAR